MENSNALKTAKKKSAKIPLVFVLTAVLLLLVVYWSVLSGGIEVSPAELFRGLFIEYNRDVSIIFDLHFPRIVIAVLGGAMLSVSGVLMQAVMRNPLAEPGIIGINSSSALAAAIMVAFWPGLSMFASLASFAGGLIGFALVYSLSWNHGLSPVRLILVGVAMNAFFSGLASAFTSATGGNYTGAASIINANITLKSWEDVVVLGVYAVIGLGLSALTIRSCNLLSLSDETVCSLGVNIGRTRIAVSLVSVFLASVFTAIIGPVSFLGLIAPHIARLLVGSDHKMLIPYSALMGSLIFLFADTLGRVIAYPYEIGAAIIMSVIGGPAFIILLKRSKAAYVG